MTLFSITIILFLIMDPLGNIGAFNQMLSRVDQKKRQLVLLREMGIALIAMFIFYLLGEGIFHVLQVSEATVYFSSGLILFLFAVKILFPHLKHPRMNLPSETPFIIPLAIPLIASPSLLATIMLFAHYDTSGYLVPSSIGIAWLISTVIMLFSKQLEKLLGNNGVSAVERLMGMILVMLAIQQFMRGVTLFIASYGT